MDVAYGDGPVRTDADRLGSSSRPSDRVVVKDLEQTYESDVKK